MPALLMFAPVPALAAALLVPNGSFLGLPRAMLDLKLAIDTPGAILLGASALLWIAAGAYARAWLLGQPNRGRFAVWWLATLTGSLGVFLAADLVGFYLFFTLVSLAAYGLVVFETTPASRRAGTIYVSLAILGEAFLLVAFVLMAATSPGTTLLIRDTVATLPTSPLRDLALALLILGFGVKIGLVPLHFWMPLTYSAAPIPAAAVLSGAAVKAGVIGLIRFLPFEAALPGWGTTLVAAGLFSTFYGVAIGITQQNPKTVLAYSSVSQIGLLAAVLGMGLAAGDAADAGVAIAAAFYAAHHILVKGGLFLAVGVSAFARLRGVWTLWFPAAVLALGLGGLPLTGGALAKLAVKAPLGEGLVGTLATLSAIGSTLLMLHFLRRLILSTAGDSRSTAPAGMILPWLAIAVAAVGLPWSLYPQIVDASIYDPLAPKELWAALWPVLIGGLLALALGRWGEPLPRIPEGDLLVFLRNAVPIARKLGVAIEGSDGYFRQWGVAGILLLALTAILAGTLLTGR